ncbi:MAG: hypothetical protein QOI41_4122, partial [Myxococcales bacterium]|nr:hypothetical protein [Myxococcales bacterium]
MGDKVDVVILAMLVVGLLVGLGVTVFYLFKARGRADAAVLEARNAGHHAVAAHQRAAAAEHRAVTAEQRAAFLSKYQAIVDVEATVAQMRGQADQAVRQTVAAAQQQAQGIMANASSIHASASAEGAKIVGEARARAEQLQADASRLEAAVRALRNIAEGYGDGYILPTAGLLDELAEEFGYTEAGEKLKAARKRTKEMIKNGQAADSNYVEPARRTDAIRFVVDAFNGKVDTILADAKDDNHGTLGQKIRDAFALVNQNGAAFRSTRIMPAYLEARLDELKWAVVAYQLRLREREEQRALKEKMRDEELAQKEYERTQKEAAKEEALLRTALDKARREVEQSGQADRERLEAKLLELSEKLRVAEEKGQRALSMAQQTKAGHVYVISNVGSFGEHVYKIGMTRRSEPKERVQELGDASVPFEFDIHALIKTEDAPALECALHKAFVANQVNKVNPRKEFFRVQLEEVRVEIERRGIPVSWTMAAACREYQETLAMQRAADAGKPSGTQ